MSIKLLILETGETVIGDIKEVMDKEKNEALGYRVEAPYVIDYTPGSVQNLDEERPEEVSDGDIGFRFWAPLSADREFDFTYDFVRVVYEPHSDIIAAYLEVIARHQAENTIVVEPEMNETNVSEDPNEAKEGGLMGNPNQFATDPLGNQGLTQRMGPGQTKVGEDGSLQILVDTDTEVQHDPNAPESFVMDMKKENPPIDPENA